MSLLISKINFPSSNTAAGRDEVTKLLIKWGKVTNGKDAPFVYAPKDDGSYWRYLVEVTVADQLSATILSGVAQLLITPARIAGLLVKGDLTKVISKQQKQKVKLDQNSGQMACFSASCDELGLVGAPTNRRGKPRLLQIGNDIDRDDGFAIKVTYATSFLNNNGATGPIDMERVLSRLEEIGLTISRGASVY